MYCTCMYDSCFWCDVIRRCLFLCLGIVVADSCHYFFCNSAGIVVCSHVDIVVGSSLVDLRCSLDDTEACSRLYTLLVSLPVTSSSWRHRQWYFSLFDVFDVSRCRCWRHSKRATDTRQQRVMLPRSSWQLKPALLCIMPAHVFVYIYTIGQGHDVWCASVMSQVTQKN